ncbi:MAG: VOC family protein [Caulobacterales bacterium]|jgi:catechol 2,3-dioxygenase-like lactoylglutathione lyase family enzyme
MRAALAALVLALFASGCISIDVDRSATEGLQRAAEEVAQAIDDGGYQGPLVKRTALVVSNMERSLTVYRDLLGFQLNSLTQSGTDSYSYEVFALDRSRPIRFATLNSGPMQQRSLALIEGPGVVLYAADQPRPAAVVINANGRFEAILAGARGMGLTVIAPRPLNSPTQGTGIEGAFLDPDGHLVVIYEFPSADPPNRM